MTISLGCPGLFQIGKGERDEEGYEVFLGKLTIIGWTLIFLKNTEICASWMEKTEVRSTLFLEFYHLKMLQELSLFQFQKIVALMPIFDSQE